MVVSLIGHGRAKRDRMDELWEYRETPVAK
jgi:hypothetical protein